MGCAWWLLCVAGEVQMMPSGMPKEESDGE